MRRSCYIRNLHLCRVLPANIARGISLSLEVRQAYRQLKTAAEKRTIARNSVEAAELNYQTRLGQYRSGVGGLTDLLQAQRSLNTMRIALADANREWHQAALQLLFSIGKAFPEE